VFFFFLGGGVVFFVCLVFVYLFVFIFVVVQYSHYQYPCLLLGLIGFRHIDTMVLRMHLLPIIKQLSVTSCFQRYRAWSKAALL